MPPCLPPAFGCRRQLTPRTATFCSTLLVNSARLSHSQRRGAASAHYLIAAPCDRECGIARPSHTQWHLVTAAAPRFGPPGRPTQQLIARQLRRRLQRPRCGPAWRCCYWQYAGTAGCRQAGAAAAGSSGAAGGSQQLRCWRGPATAACRLGSWMRPRSQRHGSAALLAVAAHAAAAGAANGRRRARVRTAAAADACVLAAHCRPHRHRRRPEPPST